MQKSKIEWCDFSINPVKGLCPMACPYCYARRMYKRFHWDETLRWERKGLWASPRGGKRIFVGSTMELFGDWIYSEWLERIFEWCRVYKEDTFIFLTKQPQNLLKWSPFPDNCWVGVSTTGNDCRSGLEDIFKDIQAKVKFVSIEPLLDYSPMDLRWVDWIIVGRQTPSSVKTEPENEWLKDIVEYADKANIPVFLKNNLAPLSDTWQGFFQMNKGGWGLRQEFPKVRADQ